MLITWRVKRAFCTGVLIIPTFGYFYLFFGQKIPGPFIHLSYLTFSAVFTVIVCCHNNQRAPVQPNEVILPEPYPPLGWGSTLPRYSSMSSLTPPPPVYIPLSEYKRQETSGTSGSSAPSVPNVFSAPYTHDRNPS